MARCMVMGIVNVTEDSFSDGGRYLDQDVAAGEVAWDGRSMVCVPVHKRGFGLMFQDGQLFEHRDVGSNIAYGLTGLPRAQRGERVREMLELVGLPGFERRRVTTLSGGQAQRVLIARALVRSPELLILDEPLAGIDRASRESLAEILQGLRAQGLTLVTVLHEMGELSDVVQRAILLQDGRLVADGPAGEVAHLRDSGTGAPQGDPHRAHADYGADGDHHPDASGPPAHHAPVLDHRLPDRRPHSGRSTRP